MSIIIAIVAALLSPAEGLRKTAPLYLTDASAREHLIAAHIAGAVFDVEPELLLSIAHHESRYLISAITVEPPDPLTGAPRWSCGVMTPEPMTSLTRCRKATRSALAGYLAGAAHLRGWLDIRRGNRWRALRGFGGKAAHSFVERAAWIKQSIERERNHREASS